MPAPRSQRAHAVDAPPDLPLARRLLEQAERHLTSAAISGIDRDSRFGMLYDAARKAADATLRIAGRRVTHGSGHHVVFIAEAQRLLGPNHSDVWAQVATARAIRNDMEYRAREVSESEVAAFREAATKAVAVAHAHLRAVEEASSA